MATISVKDSDGAIQYFDVIGSGTASEPYESVVADYRIPYSIQQIFNEDAVTVSVREKAKSLIKFGENTSIAASTREMVWNTGGFETYPTTNAIDIVVSTSVADTQSVVIEGHTISGSDLTFVTQTVTLTGTTNVTLATPLYRVNRLYNNGATDFAGTVTVEDNGTSVNLTVSGASNQNQSFKCQTALSSADYWIVTQLVGSTNRAQAATVDFEFQVKLSGKVWRTQYLFTATNGSTEILFDTPFIVPPNSEVRMLATSSANGTSVSASIHGYLAIIT